MTVSRLIARPMLASMFAVGGVTALRNAPALATAAHPVTDKVVPFVRKNLPQLPLPSDPVALVRLNAATQLLAAAGLATGRLPRLSAAVLATSLVPTTLAGHRFWDAPSAEARQQQQLHFFKNVSMLGGLLIAAGDTDGKPGVVWRTRRAARDARREAGHLAGAARREAKLAKANLT
jgi:uncharacterized membrane protein YphA (DoxX/SURF4 family)